MHGNAIYKLMTAAEWDAARAEGVYRGSAKDRSDGFIHFSTAAQIADTARKHFADVPDLLLLAVDVAMLEELDAPDFGQLPMREEENAAPLPGQGQGEGKTALRWEKSRGGDLFPHLYAPLPTAAVQSVTPAPLADDGAPIIPQDLPS